MLQEATILEKNDTNQEDLLLRNYKKKKEQENISNRSK